MNNKTPIGLYLHVPFCLRKCPYCDFYSLPADEAVMDRYADALCRSLAQWGASLSRPVATVYFGGGTPSLLGAARISRILETAGRAFPIHTDAEITLEVNPATADTKGLAGYRAAGVNRLSIGMQSGVDRELLALHRLHSAEEALLCVADARAAGFDNLSLDLMLGIPEQTPESLLHSARLCVDSGVEHLSAYLLKLESGTPFGLHPPENLSDEDKQADLYELLCHFLRNHGYRHYEISNFARPGYEARHNLKYWDCAEYLGLGPSAHSFLEGKRFFCRRDLQSFLDGAAPTPDGDGGSFEEYAMLRLRLADGLRRVDVKARFGRSIPAGMLRRAKALEQAGFVESGPDRVCLTEKGFLVSNAVIGKLIG